MQKQELKLYKTSLKLPTTLSEMNITDEKFDELKVKACYGQDSLPRAYRPLSQEDCLNIYAKFMKNVATRSLNLT